MTERVCKGCGGALPTTHGNRRYCSENCRKRRWDREVYRKPCADCAALIDARHDRCVVCDEARRHELHEALLARVERMWNDGMSMRAMAAVLGRQTGGGMSQEIDELRRAGRVGYRYKVVNGRRVAA